MSLANGKIPYLPERIEGLGTIATNLSWSWSRNARRLFALLGHRVRRIVRTGVGPVELGDLAPGASRELSPDEVRELLQGLRSVRGAHRAGES